MPGLVLLACSLLGFIMIGCSVGAVRSLALHVVFLLVAHSLFMVTDRLAAVVALAFELLLLVAAPDGVALMIEDQDGRIIAAAYATSKAMLITSPGSHMKACQMSTASS